MVNAEQGLMPLPNPAVDPRNPLSPGTHTLVVRHGETAVDQRYHVAGTGPVCVAHSGGPGIAWEYLRMPELERSMTVVYIEPVGTGASGRLADPSDYTLATYTRFLHAVIEHLGLAEVALLGHSHGGFIAQRYALDHPGRLASLVLYDTSPVTGEEFWAAAVARMEGFVRRHVDERPEVATYVTRLTTRPDRSDDDGATEVLRAIAPAYFHDYWGREKEFAAGRAALRMYAAPAWGAEPPFDVRGELSRLTVPTLILVGADDFICGPHWARMTHRLLPAARLVTLEEAGHLVHIERPEEFTAAVRDFLTG
ncbi:alpha/beta fold hydrolase [Streptomyces sp. NPDC096013]|uniref:alpha/beta fold hydrolase n=1 Tax=Streptomyces sp. NPDC096013 TaxID=3366069 RepID=UPI003826FA11